MRVLFDASAVVAGVVAGMPGHEAARRWLERALTGEVEGLVAAHGLVGAYAALCELRTRPRIRPPQALHLVAENLRDFQVVVLRAEDHRAALARAAALGLGGGGAADALTAQAALRGGADVLLATDPQRFARLGEEVAALARAP